MIPPLPPHLEVLVRTAGRNALPDLSAEGLNTSAGTNFYVLAWAASYLTSGDRDHALMRLESVFDKAQHALPGVQRKSERRSDVHTRRRSSVRRR